MFQLIFFVSSLRNPDDRIIDFPVQVHFCEIHGMSPVGNDWSPDVKKFMIKKLLGSGLEIFAKVVVCSITFKSLLKILNFTCYFVF